AYGQFVKNDGQLKDIFGNDRQEILFYQSGGAVDYYFSQKGITYIYKKSDYKSNTELSDRDKYTEFMKDSVYYFRVDMNFNNSSPSARVYGKDTLDEFNNYYLAHCPNGILNVSKYSGIYYEDIYNNIDAHFYIKEGSLKYDLILQPGADLSDIELDFRGIEDLSLNDNILEIPTDIGIIKEVLPRSYEVQDDQEIDVDVEYKLKENIVKFDADYNIDNYFIIDPQVVWQTLYEQSFGIGNSNSMDSKGNLMVNTGYTFSTAYPVLDPGGGAYFQNANAGSGDIRIVLFDTMGARIWSTYYGGTDYENNSDVVIDYNDQIVISLQTESPDIPTQNAGGYFDGSYTAGTYNWASAFIVRFNSAGVRNWATHYDHFQQPLIDVDLNNNYILVGQSQYDNPQVQSLAGAYNQTTISQNASGTSSSGDFFIAKFNSATSRVWATNLGGTCREMIGKIVVDANNNFYIW
ncbi:MAG: hypothetical protein WED10_03675, partial [Brumimicrobium sp.]